MEICQHVFSDIHEIFQVAGHTPDLSSLMKQMIRFIFSQVFAESSVVHFSKEIKNSKGDIEINLDQAFVRQYKDYYHRYAPAGWVDPLMTRPVVLMEDLIGYKDFMAGEFYNDFLVPQKIHHKLYLNLSSGFNHHTRIGLYRSRKSMQFSRKDIHMLKLILPYLGHAVDHYKLSVNSRLQNIFSDILDENISKGIILLDASFNLVHMNHAARLIIKKRFNRDLEKTPAIFQ